MKKVVLLSLVTVAILFSATLASAKISGTLGEAEKGMFKDLVKQNINPAVTGWGIGLNTASDSYLVAKFHAVSLKSLPRKEILQILKDARASSNTVTWAEVRDRIKAAIDANATAVVKGRMQINKEQYVLTGIVKSETAFTGDIRTMPNYTTCNAANVSAEDCESQSTKIGDLSLTRKTAELNAEKHRVWAGTMNFNNTAYTFVALVNPLAVGKQ